ncbi:MAG: hypothetical protein GY909_08195 [Oligoflexia bacterium]|nr:hypothetical protein [Oligoflexia bacterium]
MKVLTLLLVFYYPLFVNLAASEKTHEIVWASAQVPTSLNNYFIEIFQEELDKELKGRFKVKGMILKEDRTDKELFIFLENRNKFLDGDATSPITMTNVHSPDLADTYHLYSYNVFDLPFFFNSYNDVEKFLNSEYGRNLTRKLDNKNVVNLGFTYSTGYRVIPSLFRKIEKLSEFKGMIFRTDLGVINREFYKLLGVNVIYDTFTGSFDDSKYEDVMDEGDTTPSELFDYFRQDKNDSAKFLNLTNHSFITSGVVVKKSFINSLATNEKEAFYLAVESTLKRHRKKIIAENKKAIDNVKKMGYPVYKLKANEGKSFIKKNKSFYQKHMKLIGNDILDYKKNFLKKY